MSKTATEVIEEIFDAAALDAASAAFAPALREAWERKEWSDQKIEAIMRAGGTTA
jgi:hypothetical protein